MSLWGIHVTQGASPCRNVLSPATHPSSIWYCLYRPLFQAPFISYALLYFTGHQYMQSLQLSLLQLRQNCRQSCWISDKHNTLITKAVLFYELCVTIKQKNILCSGNVWVVWATHTSPASPSPSQGMLGLSGSRFNYSRLQNILPL